MSETIDFQPLAAEETDITVSRETAAFNEIIDEIDAISAELQEELTAMPGGKFGQNKDFSGGFGQER